MGNSLGVDVLLKKCKNLDYVTQQYSHELIDTVSKPQIPFYNIV